MPPQPQHRCQLGMQQHLTHSLNTAALPGTPPRTSPTQRHRAGRGTRGLHHTGTHLSLQHTGLTRCPQQQSRVSPTLAGRAAPNPQLPPALICKLFYHKQANIHSTEHTLKRNPCLLQQKENIASASSCTLASAKNIPVLWQIM